MLLWVVWHAVWRKNPGIDGRLVKLLSVVCVVTSVLGLFLLSFSPVGYGISALLAVTSVLLFFAIKFMIQKRHSKHMPVPGLLYHEN